MSRKNSTRQLIGIDDIKNDSVVTADGELAFYFVHPGNLNVLPEQGVRAKVQELLGVRRASGFWSCWLFILSRMPPTRYSPL